MITAVLPLMALVGVPLFAVMGLSALMSYQASDIPLINVPLMLHRLGEMDLLDSLPLFAFSGYLLARSGAPRRLLRLSNALVGWLPGGLAIVAIWVCTLVTAITGASGVTIVAMGGLLLPAMLQNRYSEKFSLGVLTAGGSLGLLFPPSLPIILFGVVSEEPIGHLFRAGVLPGILILSILSAYAGFMGVRDKVPRTQFSLGEVFAALRSGVLEALLPLGLTGGIYSGLFTISEAAVVGTLYLLIIEVVVFRDIGLRQIGSIARESFVLVGGILLILGMSMAVTDYFVDQQIPQQLFEAVRTWMTSRAAFLLSLNLFLLLVGCMIDIYAAIALIVPLILPIADEFQVDRVHLGIVFLVNMGIGYATPPVGLNLFIASVRFRRPILQLYWACLPIIGLLLVALAVITYIPSLSLVLVDRGADVIQLGDDDDDVGDIDIDIDIEGLGPGAIDGGANNEADGDDDDDELDALKSELDIDLGDDFLDGDDDDGEPKLEAESSEDADDLKDLKAELDLELGDEP